MLVLLPPSEGKTPPARGPALDLDALGAPGLRPMRQKVLDALVETSARPDAVGVLGVGASLGPEVARNTMLPVAPTARAATVYSGVLYAAAGLADLTGRARARSLTSVRTVSALWGLVSPADPIPAYRLSMGTDLPGIGPLASAWRDALREELDPLATGRLVVDCRSAAYLAAWRPPRATDWVTVRVVRDLGGVRSVVSHNAKHTRGVLTRHLLVRDGRPPRDAGDLADAAHELVGGGVAAVELGARPRSGARVLTLVVR